MDHTIGVWPQATGGVPFTATQFQITGDVITDLHKDMAAEQKARITYDNILRLIGDQKICVPIKFLRQREIVHFQKFGEANREDCSKCKLQENVGVLPYFSKELGRYRERNGKEVCHTPIHSCLDYPLSIAS